MRALFMIAALALLPLVPLGSAAPMCTSAMGIGACAGEHNEGQQGCALDQGDADHWSGATVESGDTKLFAGGRSTCSTSPGSSFETSGIVVLAHMTGTDFRVGWIQQTGRFDDGTVTTLCVAAVPPGAIAVLPCPPEVSWGNLLG